MSVTSMDDLARAPSSDQFEVSLFGPGVGESVVVHLGAGDWIVVDSCLADASCQPAALVYLKALGVDVATAVKLLVVTHWHDDHLHGAAALFKAARTAIFSCSVALRIRELAELVAVARNRPSIHDPSGINEMSELFKELEARLLPGEPRGGGTPKWAIASRPLLDRPSVPGGPACRVIALSPSDRAQKLTQLQLAEQLPRFKEGRAGYRLRAPTPNESAVALWLELGEARVLLGADLEESTDPGNGWRAIVAEHRPDGVQASTLKVPHHGSQDADSKELWSRLLAPEPYALLTPYRPQKLPRNSDLARLSARSDHLYCTADPKGRKPRRRSPAVEKTMGEVAHRREVLSGPPGHIRLRGHLASGEVSSVELFGSAFLVASDR
jgi:hypothetical protein